LWCTHAPRSVDGVVKVTVPGRDSMYVLREYQSAPIEPTPAATAARSVSIVIKTLKVAVFLFAGVAGWFVLAVMTPPLKGDNLQ